MARLFILKKRYLIFSAILFIIEVLIAMYAHDEFIRPYFGDYLVVMLIYCFIKSFLNLPAMHIALYTLLFSYAVETLQYFNLVRHLGLSDSKIANIAMGNSFSWTDMLAYTLGVLTILLIEKLRPSNREKPGEEKLHQFI